MKKFIGAGFIMLGVVVGLAWLFQATGVGINPTKRDIAVGIKFVRTDDGGKYWVFFTEPLEPIDLRGRDVESVRSHPRVVWVDTVDNFSDPRTIKLAGELGKKPHGI